MVRIYGRDHPWHLFVTPLFPKMYNAACHVMSLAQGMSLRIEDGLDDWAVRNKIAIAHTVTIACR